MNGSSLPNHENRTVCDGNPPHSLFWGTAGRFFFKLFVPDPPRGRPFAGPRRSSYRDEYGKKSRIIPK